MRFTPHAKRLEQLAASERLLLSIAPRQDYPFDFIVDRITGYRPKNGTILLVCGSDLQHDLGLLLESVSATLEQSADAAGQPVLTIEAAAQRLNVASKTLQRWRRRGLPARVFTFADGKRRIAFLLSSVEHFLSTHADKLSPQADGKHVSVDEIERLVTRARRLVSQGLWPEETARRLASRARRSPLAVLSYLKQFEQTAGNAAIFDRAASPPNARQVALATQALRRGAPPRTVAARLQLSRYAVYRILMDRELGRLRAHRVRFIDDPLYHQPDAQTAITEMCSQRCLEGATEEVAVPGELPSYLRELYRTPLLTPARERSLFLALNYWKMRLAESQAALSPATARWRDVQRGRALAERVAAVRNEIVTANLRLVVSVAKKHLRQALSLMDLVSEGNVTLLRTIDSFDVHRGYRFSTYATFALMRCFARAIPQMLHRQAAGQEPLLQVADPHSARSFELVDARERLATLFRRLNPREQEILSSSFGLQETRTPESYGELGSRLGISRQRVQQIERGALLKLRSSADRPWTR